MTNLEYILAHPRKLCYIISNITKVTAGKDVLPVDGKVHPEFDHLFPNLGVLVGEGEETHREKVDQVVTLGNT